MRENVMNLEIVLADGTITYTGGEKKRARYSVPCNYSIGVLVNIFGLLLSFLPCSVN